MSDEELLKIRNFGERSLAELKEKLADLNIPSRLGQAASSSAENGSIAAEDTSVPIADILPSDLSELMGSDDISDGPSQTGAGELEATWPETDQDDGEQDDAEEDTD